MQQPFKTKDILHLSGIPFEVVRVLPNKLQIENVNTGELRESSVPELLKKYSEGTLSVGRRVDTGNGEPLRSSRANADTSMERLGEKARAATLRKVSWIVKIRDMGGFERPRLLPEAISRVAQELGEEHPPHISTIHRWKRQFELAQRDVRGLFARLDRRGGRGQSRLDDEVEASLTEAMDTIVLGQKRSSASEVRNAVLVDLERKNAYRTVGNQLKPPSLRTVQKRMAQLYAFDVCAARHGAKEANRRYGDSIAARQVTRILQVVEVDHTPVDLWVVDEEGNVLGKPNLTALLCRYSRCVIGFFLSLVSHDVETVFGALRHALMPKDYVRERYPEIRGEWACYGWMEKVLADNGSEFAGSALANAMFNLGIVLEFCSAYQPNDKPFIERFFRTFNYGFIHHLKGTSLAKVSDRKGQELQDEACIQLSELERLIHIWIIDVYHRRPHRGLDGRSPAVVWAESAEMYPPRLKMDADTVDIELCDVETRSLGRSGIEINNHRYNSERLCSLRRMLPAKSVVTVKFRRLDLGHIFVLDPFTQEYFRVDNVKEGYANVSIEENKLLRQIRKAADPDASIQVASGEEVIRTVVGKLAASKAAKDRTKAAKLRKEDSHKVRKPQEPSRPKRPPKPEIDAAAFNKAPEILEAI
ncbi:integrase [Methylibium sp. Pch-M]|uniref:Mu transposase C-terminal domain-containing protein n=1 Tax=Methylibium sp. Pch-M TaxID=2082386 RepID=UPI001010DF5D|nr:Mu transposase C-terminal domain-containing protein [Methylibium sp. Pch-M]QAZ39569.1 integrase [Methylibium sp. Pch-M]